MHGFQGLVLFPGLDLNDPVRQKFMTMMAADVFVGYDHRIIGDAQIT